MNARFLLCAVLTSAAISCSATRADDQPKQVVPTVKVQETELQRLMRQQREARLGAMRASIQSDKDWLQKSNNNPKIQPAERGKVKARLVENEKKLKAAEKDTTPEKISPLDMSALEIGDYGYLPESGVIVRQIINESEAVCNYYSNQAGLPAFVLRGIDNTAMVDNAQIRLSKVYIVRQTRIIVVQAGTPGYIGGQAAKMFVLEPVGGQ